LRCLGVLDRGIERILFSSIQKDRNVQVIPKKLVLDSAIGKEFQPVCRISSLPLGDQFVLGLGLNRSESGWLLAPLL